jgi:hypothetical protein
MATRIAAVAASAAVAIRTAPADFEKEFLVDVFLSCATAPTEGKAPTSRASREIFTVDA